MWPESIKNHINCKFFFDFQVLSSYLDSSNTVNSNQNLKYIAGVWKLWKLIILVFFNTLSKILGTSENQWDLKLDKLLIFIQEWVYDPFVGCTIINIYW